MAKKASKAGRQTVMFRHKATGEAYFSTVNTKKQKENQTGKLKLKKYSRKLRKVVEFVQDKV